jgi:lon-related putative ATP-dependent protease
MAAFVEAARRAVVGAFEGEAYATREHELTEEISQRRELLVQELKAFAAARSHALEVTPVGIMSVPVLDGRPAPPERLAALQPLEGALLERARHEIEERAGTFSRQLHALMKEAAERMQALEREVATYALDPLLRDLEERYADVGGLAAYLEAVRQDILGHVAELRAEDGAPLPVLGGPPRDDLARYAVNVFVDNTDADGAPVVVETNPQYRNLIGRVSFRPMLGGMVTDFREVQAGALHRANGGFLVLDALDVLGRPFAWDALKRALRTGEVAIENLAEEYVAAPTPTLHPEPIPLDVKVVLIGSHRLRALLVAHDEDFRELFRVTAPFAAEMPWNAAGQRAYAAFVSRWARENGLLPFAAAAVGRLIEHGGRLVESRRRLSTRLIDVADVATEASFVAGRRGAAVVGCADVREALRRRRYRSGLAEERIQELIAERTLVIETRGSRVGELNGLSVHLLGDYAFGRPSRVSARVSLGSGQVASIERETELSGPIHSKGFLVLSGYLAATYASDYPLALSATLTFEQAYDEVDGDSASSTELYALLSALSGIPLRQDVAVTGSVDQHGRVQAIGGVNEKIEGFFATCAARGLTGTQGVMIPVANVADLMLDEEVVKAVAAGRFHVWAVQTVDEGVGLLTGCAAGRRRAGGAFPAGTVSWLVDRRLRELAETARSYAAGGAPGAPARDGAAPRRRRRAPAA